MAKAIKTTINTVSGHTVNVDKLESRTARTVKEGDYLYTAMTVRGQRVFFYGQVVSIKGNEVELTFGSYGKVVNGGIAKGAKVNVYRPTPA